MVIRITSGFFAAPSLLTSVGLAQNDKRDGASLAGSRDTANAKKSQPLSEAEGKPENVCSTMLAQGVLTKLLKACA